MRIVGVGSFNESTGVNYVGSFEKAGSALTNRSANSNPLHSADAIGRHYTVGVRYRFD